MTAGTVVQALVASVLLTSVGLPLEARPVAAPSSLPDTTISAGPFVQKYLVRGMTEAALGDYAEAISHFETALKRAPEAPALLQALADAHSAQGNPTTALFYARQARKHGEDRPYYHHRLAELQQKAGSPEAALRTYRSLLDRFPENAKAYRALAQLQMKLDRPRAALQTYDVLLEHQSIPSWKIHRKRLSLYRQVGDSSGVRKTLEALLERRPNALQYRRQLANIYANSNEPEAALDLLVPLIDDYPNDESLHRRVRQLAEKTGRTALLSSGSAPEASGSKKQRSADQLIARAESLYAEATAASPPPDTTLLHRSETLLARVLKQAPGTVEALVLRARIHEQRNEPLKAGEALKRALDENPRAPDRWARAAAAYLDAGRLQTAASVAEEGLLLFPGHYRLTRTAAFAHLRLQRPKNALNHFRSALDLQADASPSPSETAWLWAGMGRAYGLLEQSQRATKAFEKALSRDPDHPRALNLYALHLAQQNNDLDRALDLAQRAVDLDPKNAAYMNTLGWIYFRKGNLQTARRHLRKALEAGPPSPRLLEHYGDVEHALGNETTARRYWQRALDRAPNRNSLREKLGLDSNA